jgi:large subunit ribosomal protein L7/L12
VGLFGGTPDRGEMLELQNRVARLEEQVARLTAALAALPAVHAVPPANGAGAATALPVADDVYAEARALAAEGRKINAIKVVREQSGMSLKAAKDLVESW